MTGRLRVYLVDRRLSSGIVKIDENKLKCFLGKRYREAHLPPVHHSYKSISIFISETKMLLEGTHSKNFSQIFYNWKWNWTIYELEAGR